MRSCIAALLLLLTLENEASSAFLWPWEHHRFVRRAHRPSAKIPAQADCKAISAAAKRMSATEFQEALALSDDHQKKLIVQCLKERELSP